jgi:hypothetical protein
MNKFFTYNVCLWVTGKHFWHLQILTIMQALKCVDPNLCQNGTLASIIPVINRNGSNEEWCKLSYKITSLCLSQLRYSLCFMEPKDSLTYSQVLATCPYPVVPHAHQSHCPCFDHCNNICTAKSLSSSLCNFLHPPVTSLLSIPHYVPQHPTLIHPQAMFCSWCETASFTPI